MSSLGRSNGSRETWPKAPTRCTGGSIAMNYGVDTRAPTAAVPQQIDTRDTNGANVTTVTTRLPDYQITIPWLRLLFAHTAESYPNTNPHTPVPGNDTTRIPGTGTGTATAPGSLASSSLHLPQVIKYSLSHPPSDIFLPPSSLSSGCCKSAIASFVSLTYLVNSRRCAPLNHSTHPPKPTLFSLRPPHSPLPHPAA